MEGRRGYGVSVEGRRPSDGGRQRERRRGCWWAMSKSVDSDSGNNPPSRLPRSNSVEASDGQNQASESRTYSEEVAERANAKAEAFAREYPELASLPVTVTPGQKLRESILEEEYELEEVNPPGEFEDSFTVERFVRHRVPTWKELVAEFLAARQTYDDGLTGVFESPDGERFGMALRDSWTPEYAEEQLAKNEGAVRQLAGGEYPEEEESARSGEMESGQWGETATVLLGLTASSVPAGVEEEKLVDGRRPPVDHTREIQRAFSEATYHGLRNLCEYHLGLDSSEWAFLRGAEPHTGDGENAVYSHTHPVLYFDLSATDLRERFETDSEIREFLTDLVYSKAVVAHVEETAGAEIEAHGREESVTVKLGGEVERPGGYASAYLNLDQEEEMMEKPVEYVAWAATQWAAGRQRVARSQNMTEAAKVDLCKQTEGQSHGGEVVYRDGAVVCAHCGSGFDVEAETVTEARLSEEASDGRERGVSTAVGDNVGERDLSHDGEDRHVIGVSVGRPPSRREAREKAERWIESDRRSREELSPEVVMMEAQIPETEREVVEAVLAGEELPPEETVIYGVGPPPEESEYEMVEVQRPDGDVSRPGVGGPSFTEVELPARRLRQEVLEEPGLYEIEVAGDRIVTGDRGVAAEFLVEHGVTDPPPAVLEEVLTRH